METVLVNPGPATINIAGVGTATFTDLVEILASYTDPTPPVFGSPVVLVATLDNPQGTSVTGVLFTSNPALLGYDIGTSFGPISGTGGSASGANGVHHTTLGDLFFTEGALGTSTFTATTTAGVPEPASVLLLGIGPPGVDQSSLPSLIRAARPNPSANDTHPSCPSLSPWRPF